MSTKRADLRGHEFLLTESRLLAGGNRELFDRHRHFLRLVDTRQKWLLLHLLAVAAGGGGRRPGGRAAANWICERAVELGISSRNTALAYLNQLVAYGYLRKEECGSDRRIRLISLSDTAEAALAEWTARLLAVASGSDTAGVSAETLRRIHFEAVTMLLDDPKWLRPPVDVRLTQDMRGGWLVMSEILGRLSADACDDNWLPALDLNIPSMTATYGLSRSTLYRLVRLSVEAGIMGWEDRQGVATLTVNRYHLAQFARWTYRPVDAVRSAQAMVMPREARADAQHGRRIDLPPVATPPAVRLAALMG